MPYETVPPLTLDWYDVDTPDDLKRLKKDLAKKPDVAPMTFEL